jgi:hypothetical protein
VNDLGVLALQEIMVQCVPSAECRAGVELCIELHFLATRRGFKSYREVNGGGEVITAAGAGRVVVDAELCNTLTIFAYVTYNDMPLSSASATDSLTSCLTSDS